MQVRLANPSQRHHHVHRVEARTKRAHARRASRESLGKKSQHRDERRAHECDATLQPPHRRIQRHRVLRVGGARSSAAVATLGAVSAYAAASSIASSVPGVRLA